MSGGGTGTPVSSILLVVEDGSGLGNANAWVSVSDCTDFCAARGLTDWTNASRSPASDDEAAIMRATAYLSTAFTYKGARTRGRLQALAFPRTDCTDGEGEDIDEDEVPVELVQATCIAAAYERANPGGLTPTVDMTARIKSEQIEGLRTEYVYAPMTAEAARPVLLQIGDLIGGLLSSSSNPLVGTAARG